MDLGRWVLLLAVVGALGFGAWRAASDGRFRGTHRVRGGFETGAERPPQPPEGAGAKRPPQPPGGAGAERPPQPSGAGWGGGASVLAGTSYDGQRGERATLLQFSSAFCAPCRATRRILA